MLYIQRFYWEWLILDCTYIIRLSVLLTILLFWLVFCSVCFFYLRAGTHKLKNIKFLQMTLGEAYETLTNYNICGQLLSFRDNGTGKCPSVLRGWNGWCGVRGSDLPEKSGCFPPVSWWHLLRFVLVPNLNKNPTSRSLEVDIATSDDLVYCIQFSWITSTFVWWRLTSYQGLTA